MNEHQRSVLTHHTFYKKRDWDPDELFIFATALCTCGASVKIQPGDYLAGEWQTNLEDAMDELYDICTEEVQDDR